MNHPLDFSNIIYLSFKSTLSSRIGLDPLDAEVFHSIKVLINGNFVPFYQYYSDIRIKPTNSITPFLNSIEPTHGLPGTLLELKGSFISGCYARDTELCNNPRMPIVSRIQFGNQLCEVFEPNTNLL